MCWSGSIKWQKKEILKYKYPKMVKVRCWSNLMTYWLGEKYRTTADVSLQIKRIDQQEYENNRQTCEHEWKWISCPDSWCYFARVSLLQTRCISSETTTSRSGRVCSITTSLRRTSCRAPAERTASGSQVSSSNSSVRLWERNRTERRTLSRPRCQILQNLTFSLWTSELKFQFYPVWAVKSSDIQIRHHGRTVKESAAASPSDLFCVQVQEQESRSTGTGPVTLRSSTDGRWTPDFSFLRVFSRIWQMNPDKLERCVCDHTALVPLPASSGASFPSEPHHPVLADRHLPPPACGRSSAGVHHQTRRGNCSSLHNNSDDMKTSCLIVSWMFLHQVLYFPDRWWHATLNLDTSVFISTFLGWASPAAQSSSHQIHQFVPLTDGRKNSSETQKHSRCFKIKPCFIIMIINN